MTVTTTGTQLAEFPVFATELAHTLSVHSQFVLHGSLRDLYLRRGTNGQIATEPLRDLLWAALQARGYRCLICYDPVEGLTVFPPEARAAAATLIGNRPLNKRPSLEQLRVHLTKIVGGPAQPPPESDGAGSTTPAAANGGNPATADNPVTPGVMPTQPTPVPVGSGPAVPAVRAAVLIDHAPRLVRVQGQLEAPERDFFLHCQKLALTAKPIRSEGSQQPLYNPIIWLADSENDLPAWFTAGVERIRRIAVGQPMLHERETMARFLLPVLSGTATLDEKQSQEAVDTFAQRTDGMTLQAMLEISRLCRDRGEGVAGVRDAARVYRFGVQENPWRRDGVRDRIKHGETALRTRVLGQDHAVDRTMDILKRSALGLSGAQAATSTTRPRGVLFFAGPTGVGKTETAKQVADILFGNPDAYLRFDMSEFAAEHSADRLIGAPPGYVGFEAGGELTNAVRRNPFQVVLFDEIEKAHHLVLDKFLQILDEGRLTDGHGVTTYFTECVLIFTSNLGVLTTDPQTKRRVPIVNPGLPYDQLRQIVQNAIRDHFTQVLGRPELLNRLGDNIVVFDFIGPDVARRILDLQIRNVTATVERELDLDLHLTEPVRVHLNDLCTVETGNGGRGIGNLLETHLINPLSRLLFDGDWAPGSRVDIIGTRPSGDLVATITPRSA
jgi:hypothetical protein